MVERTQPKPTPPEWATSHPAWLRLEDQIAWYDQSSSRSQRLYKWLKLAQVILALGIPVSGQLLGEASTMFSSVAGALIALLEAIQHMNQYATLWVMYRSTAEKLKHEKYLFLSAAGPYRGYENEERLVMLAERVEEHVSTEHANWFNERYRDPSGENRGQPRA